MILPKNDATDLTYSSLIEKIDEGMTVKEIVKQSMGEDYLQSFNANVDLERIQVICPIGSGSFAQIYLVRKEEQEGR